MGQAASMWSNQPAGEECGYNAPVDLVHLARYSLGDQDLEREVLQLFVTQSTIYLNRLKEAHNVDQWRQAAHTIKGAARGIGAWSVADSAQRAELLGHNVEEDRCRLAVVRVENEIRTVNTYIRSLFVDH